MQEIYLMLSEECNLRCKYCYEGGKGNRNMSLDVAKKAIDLLFKSDHNNLSVSLFGGEPLVNFPVARDIVAYIRDIEDQAGKSCHISMSTNATIVNEEVIDLLEELDNVQLSVDGIEKVQNSNRPMAGGKGSFDVIKKNISLLSKPSIGSHVRMTIIPETVRYLAEGVMLLNDLGAKNISTRPVREADWNVKALKQYERQLLIIADYVYYKIKNGDGIWYPAFCDYIYEDKNQVYTHTCGAGCKSVSIVPNGDIYTCLRFYTGDRGRGITKHKIGSVDTGVDPQMEKEWFGCTRDKFHGKFGKCVECKYDKYCVKCMVSNVELFGDLFTCAPGFCETVKLENDIAEDLKSRLFPKPFTNNNNESIIQEIKSLIKEPDLSNLEMITDNIMLKLNQLEDDNKILRSELEALHIKIMRGEG